ncbi:replication restart helicase PriA [Massilimicrobiota timonensis]|uniref:replication restart helicase PriA n=1 Tax=Massilimicrobiota timonensis TaxID=1776392 RepID=UPI00195F5077|nr:primosomal protein N' [Massilimicrobiota timonensis]MBM6965137.1 primosomal protein N' [Massilimicrobiota timonensis]
MYIVKVLVEHPVHSLDTTFDYLSHEPLLKGIRVWIRFGYQKIIGYVESIEETVLSQEELEKQVGFHYQYIIDVIDEEPLLNEELQDLANQLSRMTLSPRISCLQAMLPTQLKPASHQAVGMKTQLCVEVIMDQSAKTVKQQECLSFLKKHPDIPLKEVPYSRALLKNLEKQGCIQIIEKEVYRQPFSMTHQAKHIQLTVQQQKVVDGILSHQGRVALLHGVTGSGKTEVYLTLAAHYLKNNQAVMMLVPEISLTPMMVEVFRERFGDQVAILHSRLSQGEKYDEYRRIKRQEVKIVVGARSAVFAPLENIGIIILDEEHDPSYKQESKPRYLTSQIAKIRAKTHHASVVLGSATPSLESYARALKGIYDLYELPDRINQKPLPHVEIVDMIQQTRQRNYSLFSNPMKQSIQTTIDKGEQVILLLNKRGYATYVQCQDCGEVLKCPHCDVTLTDHRSEHKLKCHYCEYMIDYPRVCPHCGSTHFKSVGYGTQKIEEEIEKLFHGAKVLRYDVDTTRQKNGHLKLLEKFRNKEANILLGTQMIAKGLDFEDVTFVGVLNADLSLNVPDFRASERTFQLLCQVSGRSGRGQKQGHVIIQTYNPDHYAITCAAKHDYVSFFHQEMKYRQVAKYPPYCHMVSILIQSKQEKWIHQVAIDVKNYLQTHSHQTIVLGPARSTIYKMQDIYRERILVKFLNSKDIYEALNNINDYYNKQQKGKVRIVCDFNPYSQI